MKTENMFKVRKEDLPQLYSRRKRSTHSRRPGYADGKFHAPVLDSGGPDSASERTRPENRCGFDFSAKI
jgi:hypothetical protein